MGGRGAVQIGNLFAFGGVMDSAGNNVLLLVDITDPANPVMTSFPVASPITRLVVSGLRAAHDGPRGVCGLLDPSRYAGARGS